jgi:hypothetical protein
MSDHYWEFLATASDFDQGNSLNGRGIWEKILPDLFDNEEEGIKFLNGLFAPGKIEKRREFMHSKTARNCAEVEPLIQLAKQVEINRERQLTLEQQLVTQAGLGELVAEILNRPTTKSGNQVINKLAEILKGKEPTKPFTGAMGKRWYDFCEFVIKSRKLPTSEELRSLFPAESGTRKSDSSEYKKWKSELGIKLPKS